MTSSISGVFFHVFSSSDDKKMDEVTRQRLQLREMLDAATKHLKECHFNQAKLSFIEARAYLKNCKKKDEMDLPEELEFYISIVICYAYTMELDSIKDINTEDSINEDKSMKSEIETLIKNYPNRHFPLFLRLLYSFKKESWREALYYCEVVEQFKVSPDEEKKYKSSTVLNKYLIPEFDIEYCNEIVRNIEEAAIYGLVEKVARLDENKSSNSTLPGLKWVNLWSKDCNEKIIKRIRSYKKPMNSFQLHKLFHSEILPKFYSLDKTMEKSLFYYYKKEFMYQCEECLRAKLQIESRNELIGRLCQHSSDDYITDSETDNDEESDFYENKKNEKGKKNGEKKNEGEKKDEGEKKKDGEEKKVDPTPTSKQTNTKENEENVTSSVTSKKSLKSQQTQTDKIKVKVGHRYVQTECSSKKKSIAIQTDVPKAKKQEKIEKPEEVKCSKCTKNANLLGVLEDIKKQLSASNSGIKELFQEKIAVLVKQIKDDILKESKNEKLVEIVFEVKQSKENIAKLEKQILIMQDSFSKERKELTEKNILFQKLLLDLVNDKYSVYKHTYLGLENNCKVVIANVTELQTFLTATSVPSIKENQAYLSRWEKTLNDLQMKNGQLKSFYKKTKSHMLHLSQYDIIADWPKIAEIPIEAFSFLFDGLKQNLKKKLGLVEDQQNIPNVKVMNQNNTVTTSSNQPVQIPNNKMYVPIPAVPQNVRQYAGAGIRYGPYQQPPPPIPMPPMKNTNSHFTPWSQNISNAFNPFNNQWTNNPTRPTFYQNFTPNGNGQPQPSSLNSPNLTQTSILSNHNSDSQDQSNPVESLRTNNFWGVDGKTLDLTKDKKLDQSLEIRGTSEQQKNDYFPSYTSFDLGSKCNSDPSPSQKSRDNGGQNTNSYAQAVVDQCPKKDIKDGFWDMDDQSENYHEFDNESKNRDNPVTKHEMSEKQGFKSQDQETATGGACALNSKDRINAKVIQRPVGRPRLVNVCNEKEKKYDDEKELIRYLKTNCNEDVDSEELLSSILKVLKRFNGSFSNVPRADILKEVRSSILTTKHGVWISPRSPLVDWENDHSNTQCTICFDDLTLRPKCVLKCKHEYHKDCISLWLRTNSICPICRVHSVIDEDYPPLI